MTTSEPAPLFPRFPADDRYARFTFADTHRMAGLLREILPTDILAGLNLEKLRRIHDQHIDPSLREIRDDLTMEVPQQNTRGEKLLIKILFEHKSHPDPDVLVQMGKAAHWAWSNEGVHPIIPILLYSGKETYKPRQIAEQFPALSPSIKQLQPTFQVIMIDIQRMSIARIWNSENLDGVAKIALSVMQHAHDPEVNVWMVIGWLRMAFPNASRKRSRRYTIATINYLRIKSKLTSQDEIILRDTMQFAHPIHPESIFARELKEARESGLAEGRQIAQNRSVLQIAKNLKAMGMDSEFIFKATGLTMTQIDLDTSNS